MNKLIPFLLIFALGCAPLSYVKKDPIESPQPIEAPALTVPTLSDRDCGRFTFNDLTGWGEAPWTQPGGEIDTIEPGDRHPAVGEADHLVRCRHVAIPPGWWVVSREARGRYPSLRNQINLWQQYSDRAAQRHQQEAEDIAELLQMARRRQLEAFAFGACSGAVAVSVVVVAIVFGAR